MSFAKLPSEILYKIGQIMTYDSHSVSSLCIVNKWTHQLLDTLLYRSVKLGSNHSVSSFCDTITSIKPHYSKYVVTLQIGPEWCFDIDEGYRPQRDFVPQIRRVLQSLIHLKHLSLSTTQNALDEILADLNVQFQLDTFVHYGQLAKHMLRFLEGQPSITRLGCHLSMTWINETLLLDALKSKPNLFKNLKELESPPRVATHIISARPIPNVTLIEPADLLYGCNKEIDPFIDSLTHAMVPITRLCITADARTGNVWTEFVRLLSQSWRPVLERVCMSLDSCSFLWFEALEKFEMILVVDGLRYNPPPSEIISWLIRERMTRLSSWRKHNHMLRSVILHGYVVPEVICQGSVLP
ncbi:hypothetical protein RSOL_012200 [Rhizoctonia solani AG-3 Rhs1AP]|uniref:F-box domain-containing protein n=2 Tax=Rhizoctonia solani AG-3 TaxID=1086053 RepID=A0A074RKW9_9AGAM|nr:hypothetical protein RSOL_012200 [Rhizoctonia solani AG-3 Rhs1AP]KEP47716.1 hypothetical protein V565_146490 [Rhizoctonia solani 123E]